MSDSRGDVLQEAALHCQRSAAAWRANGFPERAYAAERLAGDFAEQAASERAKIRITLGMFDRWIIVNDRSLAWSGSRWVQHRHGIPVGDAQICNFATNDEAQAYVNEHF
jgi:hypothetical protein